MGRLGGPSKLAAAVSDNVNRPRRLEILRRRSRIRRWAKVFRRRQVPPRESNRRVARFPPARSTRQRFSIRQVKRWSIRRVKRLVGAVGRRARAITITARRKKMVAIARVATSGSKSRIDRLCKSSVTRIAVRLYDACGNGSDDGAKKSGGDIPRAVDRRATGPFRVADLRRFGRGH
jgi:hypothetical protein